MRTSETFDHSKFIILLERFNELLESLDKKEDTSPPPLVLNTYEAAKLMKVSIPTLRDHFLCRPDFPKIRAGSKYLIPYNALIDWLNQPMDT